MRRARPRLTIGFLIGIVLVATVAAMAALSLVWTPYDPELQAIANKLQAPSARHWFGTDALGRDMFSLVLDGAQNSIAVALVALVIGMGLGVPIGALAAAQGGWLDDVIMRSNDVIFAFPAVLSAAIITASFGPGAINAIIAIGIFNIPVFARVTRASANSIWQVDYTLAARALGQTPYTITTKHILPNMSGILVVQATIQFALAILAEAGLSYLGFGAQPPASSWGKMLFEAQTLIYVAPHTVLFPGLAIALTIFGLNLLGDGLRDWLDPKAALRG